MAWALLLGAIVTEVAATMSLPRLSSGSGRWRWLIAVVLGYGLAFALFAGALRCGFELGVAYALWTALGVVATTLLSWRFLREPLTPVMWFGIVCLVAGVSVIEMG
ncbi:DMT family transporter [Gordonia polyisoprenivorans]|uniref:DMT family transporter n=1 Tax=Gordonia polyisoprenivorans TaxID=84595 RepID=UPI001AD703F4|nr:multidrug efflux SMR transporter [Gordonia polyisoprenivorans]QTI68993.1 multidrug efflux SMR transporter [Gordonia polyisoprenivorans]